MKRRRGQAAAHHADEQAAADDAARMSQLDALLMSYLRPAILAIATALLVSTPLIASESIVSEGSGATWHVMWLALAVISLLGSALFSDSAHRWSWADLCVGLLVGWHIVAAAVCDGNQRHAWNAAWQWAAYGAIAVIFRQQLTSAKETRALVVVMLALAMAVSLQAYYQYGFSHPQLRAQFKKDPDKVLQLAGIHAPPGTPERAQFESRIQSLEPTAEFALTNSLAGYLLPWLLVAFSIAFWSVQKEFDAKTLATFLVIALVIFGVLLLTKSRTAWLAGAGGCVLVFLYGRRTGWQLDWRWPAGIAAAVMVLAMIVVAAQGLDAEVLSESPKSVLYRLEYWRATAGLIAAEPWFGVGPGNFQERYVNYKLPEASETIKDPHNFLLEVWSTAGTPALLALFALMGTTAWQLSRRGKVIDEKAALQVADKTTPVASVESANDELKIGHFAIFAGAVMGLLLGGILGFFIAFDALDTTRSHLLDASRNSSLGVPIIWLTSLVSYIVCFVGLQDWVNRGELPRSAVVIALLALLVNLLAAGSAIFPGVVNSAWLLWAIALQRDERRTVAITKATAIKPAWTLTKIISVAAAAVFLAAVIACYYTEYQPVIQSRTLLMTAADFRARGKGQQTLELAEAAIETDPWSPAPRRYLAQLRFGDWLANPVPRNWTPFIEAADEYEQASPYHYPQHEERGQWFLLAGRRIKDDDRKQQAAEAYQAAIKCYPNSAMLHAQLAAIYAEIGRTDEAKRAADEAARLNALCPHVEQKLENRELFDPPASEVERILRAAEKQKSAADVVAELRGVANNQPAPIKPASNPPENKTPAESQS